MAEERSSSGPNSEPNSDPSSPVIDPEFVRDLRCPLTHRPLVLKGDRLLCYESQLAYRIEDGIPVLLIDEATPIPESELPEEFRGKERWTGPREGADASTD